MKHSPGYGELLMLAPLAVLMVRGLRRFLDLPTRLARWNKLLGYIWVPAVVLFVVAQLFNIRSPLLSDSYWLFVLLVTGAVLVAVRDYRPARTLLLALAPFLLHHLAEFIVSGSDGQLPKRYDDALDTTQAFAIIWLITFVIIARNQKKTLEKERLQREEEEKAKRLIEAQNVELERLVTERTLALTHQAEELRSALTELRTTQAQLVQSEKMASLGELTAGIAHEIQNPLNFVNNFADVTVEILGELREEQCRPERDPTLEGELLDDIDQNLQKIHHHGQRAASIVKAMLEHSRATTGERQPTDINQLADEYLRLAYQGLRAKDKTFNATLDTNFSPLLPKVEAIGPDLGRVLLNLFSNAFYAVRQRQLRGEAGYAPTVSVCTSQRDEHVEIRVRDNGLGIPEAVRQKIFQPFFTTKPSGEGTGLGLSLSYDIVTQGHSGTLTVESQEGEFTEFLISLPINQGG
ncbi:histidine kinase [Hymenobacter sedentarius]|uniref:histidine kinase n=1 Tax=Hymenobacter sedentarius TaxID=1411621 RepID=A0A0U4BM40_9BACT|nr:ATP-binding protein [Hymenobacter sedentarius]ALW84810.1 histidine kinase [Hymenobacter sedentarius]